MKLEEAKKIRQACLDHAEELLLAAMEILPKHPHLAYHFSVLALEEIGKVVQVSMAALPVTHPPGKKPPLSASDDHEHKLFWAIWSPLTSREYLEPEGLTRYRDLAKEIHHYRLKGLYVDWTENVLSIPREAIGIERATTLLDLSRQRLVLAKAETFSEISDENKSILEWFVNASQNEENVKLIFGKKSLEKYTELKSSGPWIRWVKEQFDKNIEETRDILKKEMERTEPQGEERFKQKWNIKIRLLTPSHSIRQSELNWLNQMGDYWNLKRGNDHTELFVTMGLPSGISIHSLWPAALSECRRFAAALNIASFGLFWWQLPTDVSKFYLKIIDLESKCEVKLKRVPELKLDWGTRVLDQTVLFHMLMAYRFLPRYSEGKEAEMLVHYLHGVAVLGKNDIHLRMEPTALVGFYDAFRTAMHHYGDWDGNQPFSLAAKTMFERDFQSLSDWSETLSLGETLKGGSRPTIEITLTHVMGMKVYCDAYILKKLKHLSEQEKSSTSLEDTLPTENGSAQASGEAPEAP